MELNKETKLPDGLLDVESVACNRRILYLPKQGRIIVKSSARMAAIVNEQKYDGEGEILTASQAVRRHPGVFTDSTKRVNDNDVRTIVLHLSREMYLYCCRQGDMTKYLRSLIQREMNKNL